MIRGFAEPSTAEKHITGADAAVSAHVHALGQGHILKFGK